MEHEMTPQEIREDQADDELNAIWTEQPKRDSGADAMQTWPRNLKRHTPGSRPAEESSEAYRRDMIGAGRGRLLP